MKLADTPDLGSGGEIRGGSSPSSRTKFMKNTKTYIVNLIIFLSFCCLFFNKGNTKNILDYPLSFVVNACKISQIRPNSKDSNKEQIITGRNSYRICMNFIMALSTTLNRRCISLDKEIITPKNSMTFADLSKVSSTKELIYEIIDYSERYPHFINQIAWLHASKALSQKWPCL